MIPAFQGGRELESFSLLALAPGQTALIWDFVFHRYVVVEKPAVKESKILPIMAFLARTMLAGGLIQ